MYITEGRYQIKVDKDFIRLYRIFENGSTSEVHTAKFFSLAEMYAFLHIRFKTVSTYAWELTLSN